MSRANLTKLRKLLLSPNYDQINQGIAILSALNDPALSDKLHELLEAKRQKGAKKRRHFVEHAIRGVLAFAPKGSATAKIRKGMRTVQCSCADTQAIRHPADLSCLKHFEALESVEVRGASEILGAAGLRMQRLFIGPMNGSGDLRKKTRVIASCLSSLSPGMALEELILVCSDRVLDLSRFPKSLKLLDLAGCSYLTAVNKYNRIEGIEALPNLKTLVVPGAERTKAILQQCGGRFAVKNSRALIEECEESFKKPIVARNSGGLSAGLSRNDLFHGMHVGHKAVRMKELTAILLRAGDEAYRLMSYLDYGPALLAFLGSQKTRRACRSLVLLPNEFYKPIHFTVNELLVELGDLALSQLQALYTEGDADFRQLVLRVFQVFPANTTLHSVIDALLETEDNPALSLVLSSIQTLPPYPQALAEIRRQAGPIASNVDFEIELGHRYGLPEDASPGDILRRFRFKDKYSLFAAVKDRHFEAVVQRHRENPGLVWALTEPLRYTDHQDEAGFEAHLAYLAQVFGEALLPPIRRLILSSLIHYREKLYRHVLGRVDGAFDQGQVAVALNGLSDSTSKVRDFCLKAAQKTPDHGASLVAMLLDRPGIARISAGELIQGAPGPDFLPAIEAALGNEKNKKAILALNAAKVACATGATDAQPQKGHPLDAPISMMTPLRLPIKIPAAQILQWSDNSWVTSSALAVILGRVKAQGVKKKDEDLWSWREQLDPKSCAQLLDALKTAAAEKGSFVAEKFLLRARVFFGDAEELNALGLELRWDDPEKAQKRHPLALAAARAACPSFNPQSRDGNWIYEAIAALGSASLRPGLRWVSLKNWDRGTLVLKRCAKEIGINPKMVEKNIIDWWDGGAKGLESIDGPIWIDLDLSSFKLIAVDANGTRVPDKILKSIEHYSYRRSKARRAKKDMPGFIAARMALGMADGGRGWPEQSRSWRPCAGQHERSGPMRLLERMVFIAGDAACHPLFSFRYTPMGQALRLDGTLVEANEIPYAWIAHPEDLTAEEHKAWAKIISPGTQPVVQLKI